MASEETMGQRLQRLRKGAGMSQADLAKAAKVPVGTLRNWEQDRRTPRLGTAVRVARALGVTLDELAGEVESEAPEPEQPSELKGKRRKRGKGGAEK
jgi:transcriptional regulator with XRE-family HTH domain